MHRPLLFLRFGKLGKRQQRGDIRDGASKNKKNLIAAFKAVEWDTAQEAKAGSEEGGREAHAHTHTHFPRYQFAK